MIVFERAWLTTTVSPVQCSGSPSPCKSCISAGTENDCHFDPSRDLRRKVATKRTIKELTDYKNLFDLLLNTIHSAHPNKVEELMALIRKNGSMKEIAFAVGSPVTEFSELRALSMAGYLVLSEDENQLLKSPHFAEFETKAHRTSELDGISNPPEVHIEPSNFAVHPYSRVTLESLCDIPPIRVSAKPWTEVTDDSDLVSHLISLYFTWDHPCSQFVDQEIFLDHMERDDLDSEFCTPLLVNSLLSMASVCRPYHLLL